MVYFVVGVGYFGGDFYLVVVVLVGELFVDEFFVVVYGFVVYGIDGIYFGGV